MQAAQRGLSEELGAGQSEFPRKVVAHQIFLLAGSARFLRHIESIGIPYIFFLMHFESVPICCSGDFLP